MLARRLRTLAFISFGLVASSTAEAVSMSPDGVVLVNRGNGFERVTDAVTLNPGDLVLVNQGGASVGCGDGSSGALSPGRVYTVSSSMCSNLNNPANQAAMTPEPPPGVDPGAAPDGPVGPDGAPTGAEGGAPGGMSTTTMMIGAGAVAVSVGIGVAASQLGKKKSASP